MAMTRDEAIAVLTAPGQQFEVEEAEVLGVPMKVFKHALPTFRSMLEASRAFGDRTFLVYDDERWTFEEHFQIAAGLASRLVGEYGLQQGERVAIALRNYPEWPMVFWAVQAAGLVAVPLNAWWTGPELAYALEDSGASALFADGERLEAVRSTLPQLGLKATVAIRADGAAATEGIERWEDVLAALPRDGVLPEADIQPDDDATILYTSGTTGKPKGAVGTNRNHATNLMNTLFGGVLGGTLSAANAAPGADAEAPAAAADAPARLPAGLQTFPFFHIAGLTGLYISTVFGSRIVLMYKWDVEKALDLIEREQITTVSGVPTVMRQLFEAPGIERRDLSSLTGMASGGAPVPPDLITRVDGQFAKKVSSSNGYGLTETTSAIVSNGGQDYVAKPDSVGRPVVVAEVRIVDPETGEEAPQGKVGELWVKGPNVVRGYWNKPEATAAAFTDGWFHSGDLAFVDPEGFVFVVDRMKDVIIRGGENVYSAEVEAVLFEHPAVADVALIGLPHRELGEEVAAIVVLQPDTKADAEELQDLVRSRLAAFKVPTRVLFWDEPLPRTPTGKVLKRDLRDVAVQRLG